MIDHQARRAPRHGLSALPSRTLPSRIWSDWSCDVRVVVSRAAALDDAVEQVRALMTRVERAASRFYVDSEVRWANANTGRPVAVSRLLIDLVDGALDAARISNGALDPTIGRHLARLGYDRDILLVTDSEQVPPPSSVGCSTWRDVRVDHEHGLLTVPRGTALDLGATAKAQTADWAAQALHRRLGVDVLVEIGGDLAVAGNRPDWQIAVAERAGRTDQQISLHRGGLATSTTTVRTWQRGGQRMHHIVDPATGRPADGPWRTVSVAAASAVRANACSTAAIVLGTRAVPWLLDQRVAARFVAQDGSVSTVGSWPSGSAPGPGALDANAPAGTQSARAMPC